MMQNEIDGMIDLLKLNNHCFEEKCEEGVAKESLRFPWFIEMRDFDWEREWAAEIPLDNIELGFAYAFYKKLPTTLYERVATRLNLSLDKHLRYKRKDWANGAIVTAGNLKLLLRRELHDEARPLISVKVRGPPEELYLLWDLLLKSYEAINTVAKQSPVLTCDKSFPCPHCIMSGYTLEEAEIHPIKAIMVMRCTQLTADCGNHVKPSKIPAALLAPPGKGK